MILTGNVQRMLYFREYLFRFYAGQTPQILESALALSVSAARAARESGVVHGGVCSLGGKAEQRVSRAKQYTCGRSQKIGRMAGERVTGDNIFCAGNPSEGFSERGCAGQIANSVLVGKLEILARSPVVFSTAEHNLKFGVV